MTSPSIATPKHSNAAISTLFPADRDLHLRWLLEISSIPTAAGKEDRVVAWIERWARERPWLRMTADASGNLHIIRRAIDQTRLSPPSDRAADRSDTHRPIYFTAHLDHPAFVVERIVSPGVAELSFRGGVMEDYFVDASIAIHPRGTSAPIVATLIGKCETPTSPRSDGTPGPFTHYLAELVTDHDGQSSTGPGTESIAVGDVATWNLPRAELIDGLVHTPACDDLAALAAALSAYDVLTRPSRPHPSDDTSLAASENADVRLLFTRAEEIGFIGAIAACRSRSIPKDARVIALENSRSFAESPIGGGPIVRVGDRISVFSPSLTGAVAKRAEEIAGAPATPKASQKLPTDQAWRWQRKLMAGGACEASVFCEFGYESTCVCLPLGNYHNMADLDAVQARANTSKPTVAREYIARSDYDGLIDLLIACGLSLPDVAPVRTMVERLWNERAFVLE